MSKKKKIKEICDTLEVLIEELGQDGYQSDHLYILLIKEIQSVLAKL